MTLLIKPWTTKEQREAHRANKRKGRVDTDGKGERDGRKELNWEGKRKSICLLAFPWKQSTLKNTRHLGATFSVDRSLYFNLAGRSGTRGGGS